MPNLWQFGIDGIVMGVSYSALQFAGFGLLFGYYGVTAFKFYQSQKKLTQKCRASDDDF